MKNEFQDFCGEIVKAWDRQDEISPIIEKIRMHLCIAAHTKARGKSVSQPVLPPLPAFAERYREQLQSWWEMRKLHHKARAKGSLSIRSIKALENANALGVLEEFCEIASESSWLSLGFPGHTEMLEKLAQDKKFKAGAKGSRFMRQDDGIINPAYKPLEIDEDGDVFF